MNRLFIQRENNRIFNDSSPRAPLRNTQCVRSKHNIGIIIKVETDLLTFKSIININSFELIRKITPQSSSYPPPRAQYSYPPPRAQYTVQLLPTTKSALHSSALTHHQEFNTQFSSYHHQELNTQSSSYPPPRAQYTVQLLPTTKSSIHSLALTHHQELNTQSSSYPPPRVQYTVQLLPTTKSSIKTQKRKS